MASTYTKRGPFTNLSGVPIDNTTCNTFDEGIDDAHDLIEAQSTRIDSLESEIDALGEVSLPQEWMDGVDSDIDGLDARVTATENGNVLDEAHRTDAALESPVYHMSAAEKAKLASISVSLDEEDVVNIVINNGGIGSGIDADKVDGADVETAITNSDVKIPTSAAVISYVSNLGGGDMTKLTYDSDDDGKVNSAETADTVPWDGVTDKPSTYAPSSHSHTESDISDMHIHSNKTTIDAIVDVGSGYIMTDEERSQLQQLVAAGGGGTMSDADILAAVKRLDGEDSGLNADLWRGITPQELLSSLPAYTVGTGSGYSYNISDYTDADDAIQAALDAAELNGGGTVIIMEDVTVNEPIELPSNILFSTNNHTITAGTDMNGHVLVNNDVVSGNINIFITNTKINGDKDSQSGTTYGHGIRIASSSSYASQNIFINNVQIDNSKLSGICLESVRNANINNVKVNNVGSSVLDHSILLDTVDIISIKNIYSTSPAGCHIKTLHTTHCSAECYGYTSGSRGFLVSGSSQYVKLSNCLSYESGHDGFSINTEEDYTPSNITFMGCTSIKSDGHGFHLDYGSDHNLSHCHAEENEECGIRIGGINNIVISDCKTINNNQGLVGACGILLEESQHCIIASCIAYDNQTVGTQESGIFESLGDYNIFSGNNCFDNVVTDLHVEGDESFVTTALNAEAILELLLSVDGPGSGIDADTIQGQYPNSFAPLESMNTHIADVANPHAVTAAQTGALDTSAGGTVSDTVTIQSEDNSPLVVKNTVSNEVSVKFSNTAVDKFLGVDSLGNVRIGDTDDMSIANIVWHSGNSGEGAGVNATYLENHPASYFAVAEDLTDHTEDVANPHAVTAEQAGALPAAGGTLTGALSVEIDGTEQIVAESTEGTNASIKIVHTAASKNIGIDAAGDLKIGSSADMESANTIWHSGNDGLNSGLDADTIRGLTPDQIGVNLPIVTVGNIAVCNFYYGDYDNETLAIQAALDSVTGSGQISLVSPASINDTLLISSNTRFDGGWNTITMIDSSNKDVFKNKDSTGNTGIVIRNVIIDGNKTHQSAGHGIYITATSPDSCSIISLENVYVYNTWGHGLFLNRCNNINVTNVNAVSCGNTTTYDSFRFTTCSGVATDGCQSTSPGGCHVYLDALDNGILKCIGTGAGSCGYNIVGACAHATLTGCISDGDTDSGFYICDDGTYSPEDILLTGCKAYGNTVNGIQVDDGKAIKIIGCTVSGNGDDGIYINGTPTVGVFNCDVFNNTGYGIHLYNTTYCRVIGNHCFDDLGTHVQTDGIIESGTTDYSIINDNMAYGNTTTQITAIGAATVSQNNLVVENPE